MGTVRGGAFPLIEGATVVTGTMDAWGSVYGSGVIEHGDAMEVAGTSEILALLSRERRAAAGVVSFVEVDGLHLHAGPTQAGGAALAWFAGLAGLSMGEVVERAGRSPAGAGGLIFMPHLLGERAPIWDADMRGAFIGLSSEHTLDDLCRAVLEGVAYSARHLLESLEQAGGIATSELRASGGGSQSDLWCQIKADVLDRTIARLGGPAERVPRRGADGGVRHRPRRERARGGAGARSDRAYLHAGARPRRLRRAVCAVPRRCRARCSRSTAHSASCAGAPAYPRPEEEACGDSKARRRS